MGQGSMWCKPLVCTRMARISSHLHAHFHMFIGSCVPPAPRGDTVSALSVPQLAEGRRPSRPLTAVRFQNALTMICVWKDERTSPSRCPGPPGQTQEQL